MTDADKLIKALKSKSKKSIIKGQALYGITTDDSIGVSIPDIRRIAGTAGKNHKLALALWGSGIKEARMLASLIDRPESVTASQMERWVSDFNSWDICDQCCGNLFDKTKFAYEKAIEWPNRKEEYVKRAGFVMMAALSVHDKNADDALFKPFFPIIEAKSDDDRNFVKKAVNWALRQIGKRNSNLNKSAIRCAKRIKMRDSTAARWIASDALRELTNAAVQRRLNG